MTLRRITALAFVASAATSCAPFGPRGTASPSIKVGPPNGGSVVVVGGGTLGPEIYKKFIELAGGLDALIIDIPTAGGMAATPAMTGTKAQFEAAGARNVVIMHTNDRKVADSDSFVNIIKKAGGVWFDGGRHYRLVDSYGGTRSEQEFHAVLARGGVTGGSSAGASILGSFLIRGAPSSDNGIMEYPGYTKGFGFLRGTGIDQHVVARERQPDIADSLLPRHPDLLFISEDEGTAWVVQGDNAEIIGRSKAFVYNGKDRNDDGKPFLTLRPGDRYNLAKRRVTHRAIDGSSLTQAWVDTVFRSAVGATRATVLVAQAGKVLVNTSYNVPPQRRYMPTTTMPNFAVGGLSLALHGAVAQWLVTDGRMGPDAPIDSGTSVTAHQYFTESAQLSDGSRRVASLMSKRGGHTYSQLLNQRVLSVAGTHKTVVDTADWTFQSNVDELYRLELAVFGAGATSNAALGWRMDTYSGSRRQAVYGNRNGMRNAYVRFPDHKAAIIILTDSDAIDARALAESIAGKLFGAK